MLYDLPAHPPAIPNLRSLAILTGAFLGIIQIRPHAASFFFLVYFSHAFLEEPGKTILGPKTPVKQSLPVSDLGINKRTNIIFLAPNCGLRALSVGEARLTCLAM